MEHQLDIRKDGAKIEDANKAVVFLHGRGGTAEDILSLSQHLNVDGYALVAPQATNNTWYPQSFIAPVELNEPWLSSALNIVSRTVQELVDGGISYDNIYFVGFSQGACLLSEFIARNAKRYGGAAIFTGGLIGENISNENYIGDFEQTPIFIASSNPDFHVPVERVYASGNIMSGLNANVIEKVYENMGHTIIHDEMEQANKHVFKKMEIT